MRTCSEPDLYLLLYPVSLGAPCPAHMIAPFPGPLLPAFTPFPWQLSFKWPEPFRYQPDLSKTASQRVTLRTGRHYLLPEFLRCHRFFLLTVGHTFGFRPHSYINRFCAYPQRDSVFDWHGDGPLNGAEEMFFGLMRCGDTAVIFYSPTVPVHWYTFKGIFFGVFSLLFWGIRVFLMAPVPVISSLLQGLDNLSFQCFIKFQRQHQGVKRLGVISTLGFPCVCFVFAHVWVITRPVCALSPAGLGHMWANRRRMAAWVV